MGRRRNNPRDQREMGNPGKRKSKVDRFIEEADARAKLLAEAAGDESDPLAPPKFLMAPIYADVRAIWQACAELLHKNHFLGALDRLTFAMYCVYQAEFFAADADVKKNGFSKMAKATAGGMRPWTNPAVAIRDVASQRVLELSKRFGLTALDRAVLEREFASAGGGSDEWGPLGRKRDSDPDKAPVHDDDGIGAGSEFDTPPPGQRPN